MSEEPPQIISNQTNLKETQKSLVWGILAGLAVIIPWMIIGYLSAKEKTWASFREALFYNYTYSVFVLFPLVEGFFARLALGSVKKSASYGFTICAILLSINFLEAILILNEGYICLIFASPILLFFLLIGYWFGALWARRNVKKTANVAILPFVAILAVGEISIPKQDQVYAVSDTVTVQAPPEIVWKYITEYPENNAPPNYWLWNIGLPEPTQSVAPIQAVGQKRECRFKGGLAFVEEITEYEPNQVMTFKVVKQPDHPELMGHFVVEKGQMRLERNSDGSTSIIATSWYRVHVRPAQYFNWWATDITRQVHFRVLGHIKKLSEADIG